jgi:hypothetical protein
MPLMRRKELSARLDGHMERGEHLMELNQAAFDRNTQAFERTMVALDRFEEKMEENTIFIRDMNRRSERVVQDLIRGNAKFVAEQGEFIAAQGKRTDEILAEMRDVREESQAQRKALLAILDRLPPPAAAAA